MENEKREWHAPTLTSLAGSASAGTQTNNNRQVSEPDAKGLASNESNQMMDSSPS